MAECYRLVTGTSPPPTRTAGLLPPLLGEIVQLLQKQPCQHERVERQQQEH